ncbi:unnamed protein product [Orchesella dallaii]|uniref:Uncharacterized protein n=1 Tax=Orchesella dallaii TaxID=48710 RepID=A0ABP1RYC4_9HEXA
MTEFDPECQHQTTQRQETQPQAQPQLSPSQPGVYNAALPVTSYYPTYPYGPTTYGGVPPFTPLAVGRGHSMVTGAIICWIIVICILCGITRILKSPHPLPLEFLPQQSEFAAAKSKSLVPSVQISESGVPIESLNR